MNLLETERLLMRRLAAADLDDLYALYRDPAIRRYFPEGTLILEQTREELEWFLNGHPIPSSASGHDSQPTGAFIGRCGPAVVDHRRHGRGGDRLPDRQALATPGPRRRSGAGAGAVRV